MFLCNSFDLANERRTHALTRNRWCDVARPQLACRDNDCSYPNNLTVNIRNDPDFFLWIGEKVFDIFVCDW